MSKVNSSLTSFNEKELLSHYTDNEDILVEVINAYEENYLRMIDEIQDAVKKRDSRQIEATAHAFKGAVSNFYNEEIRLLAFNLEQIGKSKQELSNEIDDKAMELREKSISLLEILKQIRNKLG